MPRLIYIDTSGKTSLLMLCDETRIISSRTNEQQNDHARFINIHFGEMLEENQTTWQQIEAIAVLNGPGSYTGLRIGLASAKGFCYASGIPLILVNHLDLLHFTNPSAPAKAAYILKARENEYFAKAFENQNEILAAGLLNKENLLARKVALDLDIFTSDEALAAEIPGITIIKTEPDAIRRVIFNYFFQRKFSDLAHSEPFYLKNVFINKINKL